MRKRQLIALILVITLILVLFFVLIYPNLMLKLSIRKEYPNIASSTISDYDKVIILRQWAYTHIDSATKSDLLDQNHSFNFYHEDIDDIFGAYSNDIGGVWCYGAAYSLMKLYQLYGFDSYICDMGNSNVMTHVVTLVKINYKGEDILSIQDPLFNITYVDSNNVPYDYFDFLRVLKNHNDYAIKILYGTGKPPDLIVDPRDDNGNGNKWNAYRDPTDEPQKILPDGRKIYSSKLTLDRFNIENGHAINEFLLKEGHPANTIYLFLYPLSMRGEDDAGKLLESAKSIVNSH